MAEVGVSRDRNLKRGDVEGRHVVLAAALVLVVDDVLADVVVRIGILDLGLAPSVVDDEHQDQDCFKKEELKVEGLVLNVSLILLRS